MTEQNVTLKQEALDRATAKIAANLAPYQTNLSNAQAVLAAAKDKLAELQSAQEAAKASLTTAQEDLLAAQKTLAAAKKKVIDLSQTVKVCRIGRAGRLVKLEITCINDTAFSGLDDNSQTLRNRVSRPEEGNHGFTKFS